MRLAAITSWLTIRVTSERWRKIRTVLCGNTLTTNCSGSSNRRIQMESPALPSITADQSSFTPAGRLINRQITVTSPSNSVNAIAYHYDASGNMTNASGDGQTWTLTYDEDNRTTSIQWDAGITSKDIVNRYDALGRRISETVDGVTTGYVLDLSSGMERVLCDLDGNGNVTAWYVHGPDLCYRVDTTNGLICYHSDAMGNVIALTDGNTNLVAQYAYTPYGRSLGSTNFQSQISNPYLFVGSQGVQEESGIPNLYFMRARYYSADAGVFLSTDPVKHIGEGWEPVAYAYANGNPFSNIDPIGLYSSASFLNDATEFGKTTIEEFIADTATLSIQGAQWAIQNGYKSLAGIEGGAEGYIKSDLGGVGIFSVAGNAASSFAVDKSLDIINGSSGKSVPFLGTSVGVITTLLTTQPEVGAVAGTVADGLTRAYNAGEYIAPNCVLNNQDQFQSTVAGQTCSVQNNGSVISTVNVTSGNGGSGGGSSGGQSMASQTVGAMCYASTVTGVTATSGASATGSSGSTSSSGGMCAVPVLICLAYIFALRQGKPPGYDRDCFEYLTTGRGFSPQAGHNFNHPLL